MKSADGKKVILIITLMLCSFFVSRVNAQSFSASVDKSVVGQFDRFQLDFVFEGGDINNLSNFKPPTLTQFKVLSGPNQSSSMQIINGKVSGSLTLTYILQPSNLGEFTIGSAGIDYAGKTHLSSPIKIKVEKGTPQQQKESTGGYTDEELRRNVFIVAEANKAKVFQGEQITVTYKLYTKLNIASPQVIKLPSYEGFWAEEIGPIKNINFDIEMYKGERYRVAKIKQVALFPSKTGSLNVTPFELKIPIIIKKRRTGNDVFDEFFNDSFFARSETIEFPVKSNTLKIESIPLPAGAPESFSGAVGNFNFKAEVDKKDIAQNESLTLRMSLSGSGNIKLLNIPEPKLPAGFEKYEPKTIENISPGSVVSGQKIVDYLIVARTSGAKIIPAIQFSYFNPSTQKYSTISSPDFSVKIRPGVGGEGSSTSFSKEDIKLLSEDIRYIKTSNFKLEPKENSSLLKSWFWISLIIITLLFSGIIAFKRRHDVIYSNTSLLKYMKAEKSARKRLRTAKSALDVKDYVKFYSEISFALFGYLEDKLSIQKSEFTLELAESKLLERNVSSNLIERVKKIGEKCEYARFAPQGELTVESPILYEETVSVIVEVDAELARKK